MNRGVEEEQGEEYVLIKEWNPLQVAIFYGQFTIVK